MSTEAMSQRPFSLRKVTFSRVKKEKKGNNWSSMKRVKKNVDLNVPIFQEAPHYRPPVSPSVVKRESLRILFPGDPTQVSIGSSMVVKALKERGHNPTSITVNRLVGYSPLVQEGEMPLAVTIMHVPTGISRTFRGEFSDVIAGGMVRLPTQILKTINVEEVTDESIFFLSNVVDIILDVIFNQPGLSPLTCNI